MPTQNSVCIEIVAFTGSPVTLLPDEILGLVQLWRGTGQEECLNLRLVLVRLKTEIPYFPRRSRDARTVRAFLQFIEPPTYVSHLHAQKANDDSRMAGRLINYQPQDV